MVDDLAGRDLFTGIVPFVFTAEERSFRRAAQRLRVSSAAISKAVARLEEGLGTQLLARTSRRVVLTPEGTLFFERCRQAVQAVSEGRDDVKRGQQAAQGELRMSAPLVLGGLLARQLPAWLARYPGLVLRLHLTDRLARLLEDDVDVAVRIGALESSSLVARRLARPRWVLVAAPAYLARQGTPRTREDLRGHNCLKFLLPRGVPRDWALRAGARGERLAGNLLVDNGDMMLQAALAGLGLAQVFDFMVADHLRSGRLVEVLPEEAVAGPPIHALCLPRRQKTPKVRACFEFLAQIFAQG